MATCMQLTTWYFVQSMTAEAARTVAAAFMSCRLDYCNSLLYGLPDILLRKLQVCVERHCATNHWHPTPRLYYDGFT